MGPCCSRVSIYAKYKVLSKWKDQFEALKLKEKEVEKLYKIFRAVDVDGSGTIELLELLTHIDIDRTNFTERIFSIFDEDGSGEIDFREFVLSLWNYCTLSRATLDLFAFDIYDTDSSGYLSVSEVEGMLRDVYGKSAQTNQYARGVASDLRAIEQNDDLDIESFRVFVRTHPALLFPAFLMQSTLQKKILGIRFWENHANRRVEISKGKYLPIAKFMEIHLNKDIFNRFVDAVDDPKAKVVKKAVTLVENTGSVAYRKSTIAATESYSEMIEKAKVKDREREQRMNPKGKEKGSEKEKDQRDGKHSVSNRGHNDDHNQVESYAYSSGSPERPKTREGVHGGNRAHQSKHSNAVKDRRSFDSEDTDDTRFFKRVHPEVGSADVSENVKPAPTNNKKRRQSTTVPPTAASTPSSSSQALRKS